MNGKLRGGASEQRVRIEIGPQGPGRGVGLSQTVSHSRPSSESEYGL
jgi:hypothetical protein